MKYELKISQAAELLGVSESRVSQLLSGGLLDSMTINGRRRIARESVEVYRESVRVGRPPKRIEFSVPYVLMNGPYEVMRLRYLQREDLPFVVDEVIDTARAPLGTVTSRGNGKRREFNDWWEHRSIPNARPGIDSVLQRLGLGETHEVPFKNHGLSLSDCYWLYRADSPDVPRWEDVNYFDNDFDDRSAGEWDEWLASVGLDSPDNTSEGALPKRWSLIDGRRVLLKGFSGDDQRPFNEVVATALHRRVLEEGEFVSYRLAETADGPVCACDEFLGRHEEYVPACYVKDAMSGVRGTSTYDRFCRHVGRLGMDESAYREAMAKMIVTDALLANNDRHWRNFGFIRNIDTLEMRPAPLFDTGNSLWYWKSAREVGMRDWTFQAKPFGPQLEKQLSYVESGIWFDAAALDGFADEAIELLAQSKHAQVAGRLDYIAEGLARQIERISWYMRIVSARQ